MARTDVVRMGNYRSIINNVGRKYGVDNALIAAIISRESRAGNTLQDGWGDHGNAWGLMQVLSNTASFHLCFPQHVKHNAHPVSVLYPSQG